MNKAVIYARVSSKEQEAEGYSIPAQVKFLEDYASKNHFIVAEKFIDVETAKKRTSEYKCFDWWLCYRNYHK